MSQPMRANADYCAKEHYQSQKIARKYDEERFSSWHGRLAHEGEAAALKDVIRRYFKAPGRVLDLPCGTGRLLPALLDGGFRVTGGDISPEMIHVARARFAGRRDVEFKAFDAERLPFSDRSFDYVTSYRLMCHLPPQTRTRVLNEMIRVTRKMLVINYHFEAGSPLYLFNRIFRKQNCPSYPLKESQLRSELAQRKDVDLCEIRKLSWYERSSSLVVLRKK